MRRLKSLLLLLVALWLPLQAASAVAMPFCRHAAERAEAMTNAAGAHCHEHAEAMADAQETVDCDNCEMCHLATAGYLPAAAQLLMPEFADVLAPLPVLIRSSHIGDPPQDPPRYPA